MIFLGNPESRHLATWRELYRRRGVSVDELCSIHALRSQFDKEQRVSVLGKSISYGCLGLWLRRHHPKSMLHAHGASGYGLSAYLSGLPYIVTVYGSEILRSHGVLYSNMIRKVLERARAITVTSAAATKRVAMIDPRLEKKVRCFHTGLDIKALDAAKDHRQVKFSRKELTLISIRNCAAHYRIREILLALRSIAGEVPSFRCIIPLGNGDMKYFSDLKSEFSDDWAEFIDYMLPHTQFMTEIMDADICLNFPESDQTSSTLLEAMYFDRFIVTNRLDAYAPLLTQAGAYPGWSVVEDDAYLALAIQDVMVRALHSKEKDQIWGREFVKRNYSIEAASTHMSGLLEMVR